MSFYAVCILADERLVDLFTYAVLAEMLKADMPMGWKL